MRIAAKASSVEEANKLIDPVEATVRELLGHHVFAVDEETLEDAIGRLLEQRNATIAVYEDLTSGIVATKLHEASADHFVEGAIGNNLGSIRRLIGDVGISNVDAFMADQAATSEKLAEAVRSRSAADIGLAVHGVPEPGDMSQNLAKGTTHISVTDGSQTKSRVFNSAGRGAPDRQRTSMYALGLLRAALKEWTAGG